VRQVERPVRRYEAAGVAGLVSGKRGRPGNHQLPAGNAQRALALIRERYPHFGPTLTCEKRRECHGIGLAVETVRTLMRAAGLWIPRKERAPRVHQPYNRRACLGELVQIDGSAHRRAAISSTDYVGAFPVENNFRDGRAESVNDDGGGGCCVLPMHRSYHVIPRGLDHGQGACCQDPARTLPMEHTVRRLEPRGNPERCEAFEDLQDLCHCRNRVAEIIKNVPRVQGLARPLDGKNPVFLLPPTRHSMQIRGIRILLLADHLSRQPRGSVQHSCNRLGFHLGTRRRHQPDR
jgi:hypothetical protein